MKKTICILVLMVIGVLLVSCGNKPEAKKEDTPVADGELFDFGCYTVNLPEDYSMNIKSDLLTKLENKHDDSLDIYIYDVHTFFNDEDYDSIAQYAMVFSGGKYKKKADLDNHISNNNIPFYSVDYDTKDGNKHVNSFLFILSESRHFILLGVAYDPKDKDKADAFCKQFIDSMKKTVGDSFGYLCNRLDAMIDNYKDVSKEIDNYLDDIYSFDSDEYSDLYESQDNLEKEAKNLKEDLEMFNLKELTDEEYKQYEKVMDKYSDTF